MTRLTILGSGTSTGVPYIGCHCSVCSSDNPKNKRLRSSCLFEVGGKSILIDTSPDLRQQVLSNRLNRIDAVLFTHPHADHIHGIDDLRPFNIIQKSDIPIYGDEGTIAVLKRMFPYIFNPSNPHPSFVPQLTPHVVADSFECLGIPVQTIPCHHGQRWMTLNYRIGNIAWLTDTSGIPEESSHKLTGLKYLFIDALRLQPHPTHFHLEPCLEAIERIQPERAYLIHLTHDYDHDVFNQTLPDRVELAYDGLTVCE